jgi:hypothetical protein
MADIKTAEVQELGASEGRRELSSALLSIGVVVATAAGPGAPNASSSKAPERWLSKASFFSVR